MEQLRRDIESLKAKVEEKEHESGIVTYNVPQPGRMSVFKNQAYQSEFEFRDMCENRKRNGYNSGMGEIFRKVCEINPISRLKRSFHKESLEKVNMNDTL